MGVCALLLYVLLWGLFLADRHRNSVGLVKLAALFGLVVAGGFPVAWLLPSGHEGWALLALAFLTLVAVRVYRWAPSGR